MLEFRLGLIQPLQNRPVRRGLPTTHKHIFRPHLIHCRLLNSYNLVIYDLIPLSDPNITLIFITLVPIMVIVKFVFASAYHLFCSGSFFVFEFYLGKIYNVWVIPFGIFDTPCND